MLKQSSTYLLAFTLTIFACSYSFAKEGLREEVNNHLNEAQHEFLDDKDTKEAAKELRASAGILKDEAKRSHSIFKKYKLGNSANKLETIAQKFENGDTVKTKEFNDSLKTTRDSLKKEQ